MKTYNLQLPTYGKILLITFAFSLFVFPLLTNAAVTSDSGCTATGGTCMVKTGTAGQCPNDNWRPNLCTGPTERQCCIRSKSGGTGTIQNTQGGGFGTIRNPVTGGQKSITIPNPLQAKNIQELIDRVTKWLLLIGAPIATLMIIWGAFQIMTAAGNPENITKGRHTITYTVVGYALLLIATGLTTLITNILGAK